MGTFVRSIAASALFAALLVTFSTPASAELASENTIAWGVQGLATGTQTDTIKSHIFAIEQIGNRVYVGGRFLQATDGNTAIDQPFLAAFDATTGAFDTGFRPVLDKPVYALDRSDDGATLFIGGEFNSINGVNRRAIAAVDPATGQVQTGWSGRVAGSAMVRGLDVRNGALYVGGRFTSASSSAGTSAASQAARFDVATGAHDTAWLPQISGGTVWAITASPSADRVYIAGYFDQVNGADRAGGFAALNASSSQNAPGVQPFKVNTPTVDRQYAFDVEVAGGNVFVAGSEHYVQVLRESDLLLTKFHYTDPNGDFQDLEVVGDRVYAGCHCRKNSNYWMSNDRIWFRFNAPAGETNGPILDQGLATWVLAFDAATGDRVDSFFPQLTSANAGIWGIHGSPDGCLWLGGQITGDGARSADNLIRLCEDAPPGDTERPSSPRGLTLASVTGADITLTWLESTDNIGVTGYNVYDNADRSVVATTTGTTANLNDLPNGDHTYFVKAFDAAGNESWRSNLVTASIVVGPGNPRGCTILGTEGNDVLEGTSGPDVICGLGGDDTINGRGGADVIYGDEGNDDIDGASGNDQIFGGLGDDILRGSGDDDYLEGNEGDDVLGGWRGNDHLVGGEGADIMRGGDDDDTLEGGLGANSINGGNGTDVCTGEGTFSNCE